MEDKLGQSPAFPSESKGRYGDIKVYNPGINARLYIATKAMQGFISGLSINNRTESLNMKVIISLSIEYADELLKQEKL